MGTLVIPAGHVKARPGGVWLEGRPQSEPEQCSGIGLL